MKNFLPNSVTCVLVAFFTMLYGIGTAMHHHKMHQAQAQTQTQPATAQAVRCQ